MGKNNYSYPKLSNKIRKDAPLECYSFDLKNWILFARGEHGSNMLIHEHSYTLDEIDLFRNSTRDGNLCVESVLKSSRTLKYDAVLRGSSPAHSLPEASSKRDLMKKQFLKDEQYIYH